AGLDSVSFSWSGTSPTYGYQYQINNGTLTNAVSTTKTLLDVNGLQQGDHVTLWIWSIGSPPCGNSDTVSISCQAKACPFVTLAIQNPGNLCDGDDPLKLTVFIAGTLTNPVFQWSGPGITDPVNGIFDPSVAGPGTHTVTLNVDDGGCAYSGTRNIQVIETPKVDFNISGVPCIDSVLTLDFTGTGYVSGSGGSEYWNLDGGTTGWFYHPPDAEFLYHQAGDHTIQIAFGNQGCVSDTFAYTFSIDAPLDPPLILCAEEDYTSLKVEWDPVPGATSYDVSSTLGTGKLSGTTYTVSNLPDDTDVDISVTVNGVSACGPSSATITCHTLKLIPINTYVPDAFSPNHDGINDIFFIQS
ncbi:MAG TPA: hypothetical protein VJ508_15430, partial [Saprospiraceae bacterium]|nr:hypothetical protein [Saprospiraceae bacterium]